MEFKIRHAIPKWLVIFILALVIRSGLNLFFFTKFGPHATVEKEIWYYYGVLNNSFHISHLDLTYWVMRLVKLCPEKFWFSLIAFMSSLFSSLTVVLIYFFARKLFDDEDLGFGAGLTYAFLAGPLGMSVANFTHDIVQLPIIILLFLTTLYIHKNNGLKRIIFIITALMLACMGFSVGPLIIIAALVCLLYLLIAGIKEKNRLFVLSLAILAILFVRLVFLDNIIEALNHFSLSLRGIDLFSQISVQARDLTPVQIKSLCLRIGVWSVLVFLGLCFNRKKIEPFSLLIFFVGIIFAFAFARLVRIVDIACALLAAYAFNYSWLKKLIFRLIPALGILTIIFCSIYLAPNTTEAEYKSFVWLKEHYQKQDKVLIAWPYGYFLKAVSGLEPTSTPQAIDFALHKIYWDSLDNARKVLKEKNIKLIYVSNKQFSISFINLATDEFSYIGDGSLVYRPEEMGINKFSKLEDTFLFKLLDDPEKLDDFRLVRQLKDRATSKRLRIFEVR